MNIKIIIHEETKKTAKATIKDKYKNVFKKKGGDPTPFMQASDLTIYNKDLPEGAIYWWNNYQNMY